MQVLQNKLSRAPRGRTSTLRLAMRINNGNPHKPRVPQPSRNPGGLAGISGLMLGLYARAGIAPGVGEDLKKRPVSEGVAALEVMGDLNDA